MATALKPKEVRPCGAAAGRFGPFLTVFAYKPSEAPTGNYAKKSRVILPAMRVFEVQNPSSTKAYSHSGCEFRFWAIVGARFVSDRNRNAALHPERPLQSYARLESHSVTLVRAYAQVELGLSALLPPSLDVVDAENSSPRDRNDRDKGDDDNYRGGDHRHSFRVSGKTQGLYVQGIVWNAYP